MKILRKKIIFGTIILCFLLFSSMIVGATGVDPVKIAFSTHLKGNGVDEDTILKFKEVLEDISNNKFQVDVSVGGVLGNETDLWELLGINEIQMNMCGEIIIPSFAPGKYVFGIPFLYDDPKVVRGFLDGPLGDDIKDLVAKNGNMIVLGYALREPRMLTSNKPIRKVDDIKGLKLRLPPFPEWIEVWEELGANAIAIAGSEMYQALQSGLAEGQDNPASVNVSFKMYEVQKYMTRTNHIFGFRTWLMSESFYNSLTSQEKDWISYAVSEAINYFEETVMSSEEKNIEILKEKGMELTEIEDIDTIKQKIKPAIERLRENWDEDIYEEYVVPFL